VVATSGDTVAVVRLFGPYVAWVIVASPLQVKVIAHARIKNEVHAILHTHLSPPCPHADLFGQLGRSWLGRHLHELDRIKEDLVVLAALLPGHAGTGNCLQATLPNRLYLS